MQIKVEEELETHCINALVKEEVDAEMTLIKGEDSNLGNNSGSSSNCGCPTTLEPDPHAYLLEYLKLVGATQNVDNSENVIHDRKIFNPTPEVKKYRYNNDHSCDEGYVACGVNRQDNHWCRFYRKDDPQHAIGFRYLNCDNSIFYNNPDNSKYYADSRMEWFQPPPQTSNEGLKGFDDP